MKYIKNIFAVGVLALGLSSCSDYILISSHRLHHHRACSGRARAILSRL